MEMNTSCFLGKWQLEMAARAHSAPLGRSKWLLEPAQFGSAWLRKHRTCRGLRHRARSAPLGRSKWPREPVRLRWGARNSRSSPLGSTGAPKMAARTRSAPPRRSKLLDLANYSKTLHLPTFPKSSPLGSAGEPPRVINYVGAFCAKIFTNAILFSGETLANRGNEAIQG